MHNFVISAGRTRVLVHSWQAAGNRRKAYNIAGTRQSHSADRGRQCYEANSRIRCEDQSMLRSAVRSPVAVFNFLILMNLAVLLSLAACRSERVQWNKPGASEADFERDWQRCSNLATGLNPPVFDPRTMTTTPGQQATFQQRNSCMFSRGWQLEPKQ